MLNPDTNNFIKLLYDKSALLHEKEENYEDIDLSFFEGNEEEFNEYEAEEDDQMQIDRYDKIQNESSKQSQQFYKAAYKQVKRFTANDVYFFIDPKEINTSKYLPSSINYIEYPRKKELLEIIERIKEYQDSQSLVDFHPKYDDLRNDLKEMVDQQYKKNLGRRYYKMQKAKKATDKAPRIQNILHQSLQPYHASYSNILHSEELLKLIWERQQKIRVDTWGKRYASSPSQFLWLPAQFVYSPEENSYAVKGKLFHPLEESQHMPELKKEVSQLLTYFAPALKTTHEYFSELEYQIDEYDYQEKLLDLPGQMEVPSFDEKIHAIVKISEMTIEPHSTYTGQWHVEGYSSDNILYTCLYVIQQDENLIEGRLKFKRASRADDAPLPSGEYQPQCAHSYCPDYDTLCHPHQLIPLGSLDIKENLMIVFPNQNIHKVKGFKNDTDAPLKRKIIAFFVVNHEAQPFTVNDVSYTQPLSFIKEQRLLDMYERSKNKQTDTQSFSYCEH